MKIQFWCTVDMFGNTVNTSITGEGSIIEECEEDAKIKLKDSLPFIREFTLQKVATLEK